MEPAPAKTGLPLWAKIAIGTFALIPIIVVASVVIIPVWMRGRAIKGERTAVHSLRTLAQQEAQYKTTHGVYWTADVAGLVRTSHPKIAAADLAPVATPSVRADHDSNWYRVVEAEGFAFAAIPVPDRYAQRVFIIGQEGVIFSRSFEKNVLTETHPPSLAGIYTPVWPPPQEKRLWRRE